MKRKTDAVSRSVSTGVAESEAPAGVALLHQIKKVQARLRT